MHGYVKYTMRGSDTINEYVHGGMSGHDEWGEWNLNIIHMRIPSNPDRRDGSVIRDYFIVGRGISTLPDGSCPWYMTPSEIEATIGALTRLRRLSVISCSSAASATAHAPGVGGIQLYGGPYGWVRAGLGLGATPLSFSLRE